MLGEGDYLRLSAREMVESPEQTALDFGSSQGDKTGYSSHNQGAETEAFILKLFLTIFYLRKEAPRE